LQAGLSVLKTINFQLLHRCFFVSLRKEISEFSYLSLSLSISLSLSLSLSHAHPLNSKQSQVTLLNKITCLLSRTLGNFLARPAIQPEALAGFAFSQVEAFKFLFFIIALSVCACRPAAFAKPEVILLARTTRNVVLLSRSLARSLARPSLNFYHL
jgi:hypothetical protein